MESPSQNDPPRRSTKDLLLSIAARVVLAVIGPPLRAWDRKAALSASLYLTSSTVVADAIYDAYGLRAEVIPPPPALGPDGHELPLQGIKPGFFLCIARLLPYKNVDVIIEAMKALPSERLVVVGEGPQQAALESIAGSNVRFVGSVDDAALRWAYRNTQAVVSASFEDYGLTPLEAASFGKPVVVLRAGGFLDTVVERQTGLFFDEPKADQIEKMLREVAQTIWEPSVIITHVQKFSAEAFQSRIRQIMNEQLLLAEPSPT